MPLGGRRSNQIETCTGFCVAASSEGQNPKENNLPQRLTAPRAPVFWRNCRAKVLLHPQRCATNTCYLSG